MAKRKKKVITVYVPRCAMFALCSNAPTHVVPHPVLGSVYSCERCATKLGMMSDAKPLTTFRDECARKAGYANAAEADAAHAKVGAL